MKEIKTTIKITYFTRCMCIFKFKYKSFLHYQIQFSFCKPKTHPQIRCKFVNPSYENISKISFICNFFFRIYLIQNNFFFNDGDVSTSIIDPPVDVIPPAITVIPTNLFSLSPIQTAKCIKTVNESSKMNEQNCPRKVIAFCLFLNLITFGSRTRRRVSLLSCL